MEASRLLLFVMDDVVLLASSHCDYQCLLGQFAVVYDGQ